MDMAGRIQHLRKLKGISQEELADRIGVSRQAVSKWESSQSSPDIDKVVLLSEYFETTTDYLLKGIEPQSGGKSRRDAVMFSIAGTALNAIGLFAAIAIWIERQMAYSVFVGLIVMVIGTVIFAAGQIGDCKNSETAKTIFALANVWILLLMPVSCCFNILDGLAGGFAGRIAPLPLMGNSVLTFGGCWLFYIALCAVISTAIRWGRKRAAA